MLPLPDQKRRIAIYIRVSTTEQQTDGYGLEAQRHILLEYVKTRSVLGDITKPEWIFVDTHSGGDLNRPGLNLLREAIKNNLFDAVLVLKIDRLSRSLQHLLTIFDEMERHNVCFVSFHENLDFRGIMGRLVFQVLGAFAQFERELIKDRTKMGRIASAQLGNFTGAHVPFGYKAKPNEGSKGKKVEVLVEEQKWVKQIFQWYVFDGLGSGQIANKLNELKVARGKYTRERHRVQKWTDDVVGGILTNPIYRGTFIANQTDERGRLLPQENWTLVQVPACVSELLFLQAQMRRKENKGGNARSIYLLSGKVWDMTLEKPRSFVGVPRTKGGFSYRRKPFEKDGKKYGSFEIPGKMLEEFVWQKLLTAIKDPESFLKSYLQKNKIDQKRITELEDTVTHLREQLLNMDLVIGRIESALEQGIYSNEKANEKLIIQQQEKLRIEDEIVKHEQELKQWSSVDIQLRELKSVSEQLKYHIDKYDRKDRKLVCQLLVQRVEMYRERQSKGWHTHAKVHLEFNLLKLSLSALGGGTLKALPKDSNLKKDRGSRLDGAEGGSRTLIPFDTRF